LEIPENPEIRTKSGAFYQNPEFVRISGKIRTLKRGLEEKKSEQKIKTTQEGSGLIFWTAGRPQTVTFLPLHKFLKTEKKKKYSMASFYIY